MKIGLITYDRPHRKTWDLSSRLYLDEDNITFLYVPWKNYTERHPLITHRPDHLDAPDIKIIAEAYGWKMIPYDDKEDFDLLIIGGCQFIPNLKALNSHPGYLPYARGLDALKWAVYDGSPIGVAVHWTNNELDEGKIVYRKIVPLYFEDTFHSLAYRVYEAEIQALLDVIRYPSLWNNEIKEDEHISNLIHGRMPQYKEQIMLERFENRRKKSPSKYG
jgi:phosphoribosylglycinamide formyltransferase-1